MSGDVGRAPGAGDKVGACTGSEGLARSIRRLTKSIDNLISEIGALLNSHVT